MSFINATEMLAFDNDGRQARVPETGSWVEFDCTRCGAHTETPADQGYVCCDGCEAYAPIPAEWRR
jgi:hypothetical protein